MRINPPFIKTFWRSLKVLAGANPLSLVDHEDARRAVLACFPKHGIGAEIGVFRGDFSKAIRAEVDPQRLYLIDPWANSRDEELKKAWYSTSSENNMDLIFEEVKAEFYEEIQAGRVVLLRGGANDFSDQIEEGSLDFVYIDGDHRYDGVMMDLEFAFAKVKVGGIIAADDYSLGGWWGDGVIRAVNEFIGRYPSQLSLVLAAQSQVVLTKIG